MNLENNILFRPAILEDAEQLIQLIKKVINEAPFLILQNGSFNYTIEEEKEWIADVLSNESSQILLAFNGEKLIGSLTFIANDLERIAHTGELSMAIDQAHKNQGIGSGLLDNFFEELDPQIKRVELSVIDRNTPAIHLYKKFEFIEEGRQKNKVNIYGEYFDLILMGKLI